MASAELIKAVNEYNSYIKRHGIDEDVINAYVQACQVAYVTEFDLEYGAKLSANAKWMQEKFCRTKTGGALWDLEKHAFKHKTWYDLLDKYYTVLLYEAQSGNFDSYMLYLEKKREPKARFYMPKRKQFHKFGLIEAYQGMLDDKYDILCISQPPGTGKAQPLYSKVLTPDGFKRMGSIKVGDKVIAANGNVSTVLGVYPQGKKPVYELIFDDGSTCRSSDEHLWTVRDRNDRVYETKRGIRRYQTLTLKEMIGKIRVGNEQRCNYSIDYVPKIDSFSKKELKLHPYVMGVLIGDGCFTEGNLNVSSPDKDLLERFETLLPEGCSIKHREKYDYRILGHEDGKYGKSIVKQALKDYGLYGKGSSDKFIPADYLYSSYEDRLELLRGLLDTDGYAYKNGVEFSTASPYVCNGIIDLVHSLGGYAHADIKFVTGYRKDGEFVECKPSNRLNIQFSASQPNPFWIKRKADIYKPKREKVDRFITDIKYIGEEECQCIYIDDPCHLYITDDYVITHNTTLLKFFNSAVIGWFPRDYNLFYSHSSDITRMYYDGVYQMVSDNIEYTWKEIFPELQITSTNAKMQQFNIGAYKPFPSLQTAAVGSENAGKVRASKFLLVDDMIGKLEEALNKNILEKLWGAYTVDARQRKTMDSENKPCKEIIQATRWSTLDPIGRLIKMYAGNERVKVIAIPDLDPETGESNFDYEFGGFTKEFFADQALLMDDVSYKCLYKQEPIEREGLLFPEDKTRRYLALPSGAPEIIYGQCDTKGKGTDYFVLPVLQKYGEDYYCVDCVCSNSADYEIQYENAANVLVNNKVQDCEFERNAGGDRVAMEVNKRVIEKGWVCNITDVPTETNKEARIYQYSSWILQHVIFKDKSLYTPKDPYGIMMSLLHSYSVSSAKQIDDVPDCFSNFAKRIVEKYRVMTVKVIHNPFG